MPVKVEHELDALLPPAEWGCLQPAHDPARADRPAWPGNRPVAAACWPIICPSVREPSAGDGAFGAFSGNSVVTVVKYWEPRATMVFGTGSRHLVPKESLLGSASRPTRPMPAFGPALVFPAQATTCRPLPWYYSRCYPRSMVTKRSVSLGRRGGVVRRAGGQAGRGLLQRLAVDGGREAAAGAPGPARRGGLGGRDGLAESPRSWPPVRRCWPDCARVCRAWPRAVRRR